MTIAPQSELSRAELIIEPAFFSIPDLARRWRCSRGSVYNRLRGEVVLDFGRQGRRGHKLVPRETVLAIEEKLLRVLR